jgi:hypothetical protein
MMAVLAGVVCLPFLSFYWSTLLGWLPGAVATNAPGWMVLGLYVPFMFFAGTLFSNAALYLLTTAVSVVVIVGAWLLGRANWRLRGWLLILLIGVLAFPLTFRYRPALGAAPGYRMRVATAPGFPGGIVKGAHNVVERTPCEYELLGWSADPHLYYRAVCGPASTVWRYAPSQTGRAVAVDAPPSTLNDATLSSSAILKMVRGTGVKPQSVEPDTRPLLLAGPGRVSPDGEWIAVVTRHVYGTQDVIVLTEASMD